MTNNQNVKNIIGGVGVKSTPLISFNAIIDTDVGLARLVHEQYLNPNVFDPKYFQRDFIEIIGELYRRSESNPLYLFARDTQDKDTLDTYYKEFLEEKEKDILERSISTEVINMIDNFNSTLEIQTTILYYTAEQKRILDEEPILSKNPKVYYKSLTRKEKESYSQYFFKTLDEAEFFISSNLSGKTIYFSYCGQNLNENKDSIKDSELITFLLMKKNNINLFDIYRNDIIGRKE